MGKIKIHQDSITRFKRKLKKLTKRSWSVDMTYRIKKLNEVIRGFINYFKIRKMRKHMELIDRRHKKRNESCDMETMEN